MPENEKESCVFCADMDTNVGIDIGTGIDAAGVADASAADKSADRNPIQKSCCTHKVKERSTQEYKDLLNRLNRIEGQVRGIKGMVEKDVYCTDILVQVAAVNAALNSFNKVLLANHIKTCVTRDIREGKEDTVDELVAVLQKLMK